MYDDEQLRTIVRQFFETGEECQIKPFGNGLINDTYLVAWPENKRFKGKQLLQRLNHFVFKRPETVMKNISKVAVYLQEQGFDGLILSPLLTVNGLLCYQDVKGNYWRMFPFFENTYSIDKPSNSEQVYQAGRAFGLFFHALAGMDVRRAGIRETIPGFHNSVLRFEQFKEVVRKNPVDRLKLVLPEITFMEENKALFFAIDALPTPRRITHNDTKINNVLFDQKTDEVRGVIDWDTIMPGTVLSDFGDMARTMTPTYDENHAEIEEIDVVLPFFEALCQGFLSAAKEDLEIVESASLVQGALWIILEQAMRFLTDFLNGDSYYKTDYPQQNLIRTKNQTALFQALKRKEKRLNAIIENMR